jgi:excisionase family DNA binding protein
MDRIAVSLAEAERLTSISRFTLRRQIKRGLLRAARVGRRLVIPVSELEKLVRPFGKSGDTNG